MVECLNLHNIVVRRIETENGGSARWVMGDLLYMGGDSKDSCINKSPLNILKKGVKWSGLYS